MQSKKRFTPEQKVIILRELLENKLSISQVAEKDGIHVNDIYSWKKKLFENASAIYAILWRPEASVSPRSLQVLDRTQFKSIVVVTFQLCVDHWGALVLLIILFGQCLFHCVV